MNNKFIKHILLVGQLTFAALLGTAPIAMATEVVKVSAAQPLSQPEFAAIVVEAFRRARNEDPAIGPWYSLDRTKLTQLLHMPEFGKLDYDAKEQLIDQAGVWDLMPFERPSEVVAMWVRWFPGRSDRNFHFLSENWAPESGATLALMKCWGKVWYSGEFGKCVHQQYYGRNEASVDTQRGGISAAILETKLSNYLLKYRCSGKGVDDCLEVLRALQSLNPQHEKLSAIIKLIEPDFTLAEEVIPFEMPKSRLTDFSDLVMAHLGNAERRKKFLDIKLRDLFDNPSAWPADELEKSLRILLKLTKDVHWASGRRINIYDESFEAKWWPIPVHITSPSLASALTKLGKEYALASGCDFANMRNVRLPESFWIAYSIEKFSREQTSCDALRSRTDIAFIYLEASMQSKPQMLEPYAELQNFLDKPGKARDELLLTVGARCPSTKVSSHSDPWKVCSAQYAAVAEAAAKERAQNEQQVAQAPACLKDIEIGVALELGYVEGPARHVACKPMPSDPAKSIVALSIIRPESATYPDDSEMGDYALDVLIVKSTTGDILSKLHLEKAYYSDAWRFYDLAIDTGRYTLAPKVRAFGIRAMHEASSRVNPTSETVLNLYVAEGKIIRPILHGLIVNKSHGEWDGRCNGHFSETQRTIKIASTSSNGFADLIVVSTTNDRTSKMVKDVCKNSAEKPYTARFTLRYDGNSYAIPAELQGIQ